MMSGQPWRMSESVPSKSNTTCEMPGRGAKLGQISIAGLAAAVIGTAAS
jgi:hypothetical protein